MSAEAPKGAPPTPRIGSVYVHAPFCARRCVYCDFAVHVDASPDALPWVEAVAAEWAIVRDEDLFEVGELETLYVGGGTPSLLGSGAMRALWDALQVATSADLEWTVEANPESLTAELASAWRRAGVNRLSLGVQSFQDGVLAWMGRLHGRDGARRAVRIARAAGFEDLSLDLIFALPAHLERDWRTDLEELLALDPSHVSLYGLGVESGTALGRAVREGREPDVDEDRYAEEYLEAVERLCAEGFEHYEVSNFARDGRRSKHNAVYWSGKPYLGLGNGAHSYLHPLRRWNLRDWREYRDRVAEGRAPTAEQEVPSAESFRLERIWLGLRTREGLDLREGPPQWRPLARRWQQRGWAVVDERARLTLTALGWLFLDRLAVELDEVLARNLFAPGV